LSSPRYALSDNKKFTGYWRLLAEKKDVGIFDDFSFAGNRLNKLHKKAHISNMYLLNNGNVINIYEWALFRGITGALIQFINYHYTVKVNRRDFKTAREMIEYILEKENEKDTLEKWPPKEWTDSVYYKRTRAGWISTRNFYGNILLKNGDSLSSCYIRPWFYDCDVLADNKFQSIKILDTEIKYMRVPAPLFDKGYMEMSSVYGSTLLRLIRQKGEARIYDYSYDTNPSVFGSPMLLVVDKNKPLKIYGNSLWPRKNTKNLILKFVNTRYHQSFKQNDFKTEMDMLDYILDRENEKGK